MVAFHRRLQNLRYNVLDEYRYANKRTTSWTRSSLPVVTDERWQHPCSAESMVACIASFASDVKYRELKVWSNQTE